MIALLEGQIVASDEEKVILLVGGVGFAVYVAEPTALPRGETVRLHTHLYVRENELTLYGFPDEESRELFRLLIGVSRVGPKVALSLLRTFSPETMRRAIADKQSALLTRAPGVGKRMAEAIVFHLHDKVGPVLPGAATPTDEMEVIDALTALGFSLVEAQRAVQRLPRDRHLPLEEKIRLALAALGR